MIDDSPPRPPNMPPPNSMPSRPAPRKPAARPPSMPMPGRLKKPPLLAAPARHSGAARLGHGAVERLRRIRRGRGARRRREGPRPPRARTAAAADPGVGRGDGEHHRNGQRQNDGDRLDDAAHTLREIHGCSLIPRQGEAPLRWALVPKSEAPMTTQGCGARSRAHRCRVPDAAQRVALRGVVRCRAGTVTSAGARDDPGSAEQREERCTASGTRERLHPGAMVCLTFSTSALSANGFGRKANCSSSRSTLLSKASSA